MHSRRIQKKVKKDYNKIAESFAETRQFPWEEFELFLKYYDGDEDVLDLGCGNGRLLKFLKKHGFGTYLGVDQSEKLLEIAEKEHPDQEFLCADMCNLDLGKKYDAIFAIASFHHVPPRLQEETLKSWKKFLKPGGYLFMTNWNLYQSKYWPLLFRSFIFPIYGFGGLLVPWKKGFASQVLSNSHQRCVVKRYYFAFTKRRLSRLLYKTGYEVHFQDSGKNIVTIARNENS